MLIPIGVEMIQRSEREYIFRSIAVLISEQIKQIRFIVRMKEQHS